MVYLPSSHPTVADRRPSALLIGRSLLWSCCVLAFFGREWRLGAEIPGPPFRMLYGGFVGVVSTLMSIGGGVFITEGASTRFPIDFALTRRVSIREPQGLQVRGRADAGALRVAPDHEVGSGGRLLALQLRPRLRRHPPPSAMCRRSPASSVGCKAAKKPWRWRG